METVAAGVQDLDAVVEIVGLEVTIEAVGDPFRIYSSIPVLERAIVANGEAGAGR